MLLDKEFASVAELDVRKLNYALQSLDMDIKNEERALELLNMIRLYGRDFGIRVKEECLSAVYEAAYWIENEIATVSLVSSQTGIVSEVLPIGFGGLRHARRKPLAKAQQELITHAINIAGEIAYAICKYVRNKEVVKPAARLLYSILRFSDINGLTEHKQQTMNEFSECLRISQTPVGGKPFAEGAQILSEYLDLALDRSND